MKKISKLWNKLNIKHKLFTITSGLLLLLAFIIYLTLYYLMPYYYHEYKKEQLDKSVVDIVEDAKFYTLDELRARLYYLSKKQNLSMILMDENGFVISGQKDRFLSNKYNDKIPILYNDKEDSRRVPIKLKDSDKIYYLEIAMPLQPIDEASEVIRKIMPFIILIAFLIALIGSYIYSNTITKPLIEIINKEREEERKRKEFIATISHELKTPITIISGQLEGMIYNIGKYKDRETYLRKSYESTLDLKLLVDEMMQISKNEILERNLNIIEINLGDLLNELVNRQSYLIEEKNINLTLDINDNLIIKADKEKIIKVINNLINNAIKYSPQYESIYIRGYKLKTTKRVKLEIENTGVTIDERYLSEVFNPFFRIEKSRNRKTGGSGLGLYIVSQILKSHDFDFNIQNRKNSVVFHIYF